MQALEWDGEVLRLIDQTLLPLNQEYVECRDYRCVARAIRQMQVRGAPAIGAAAAFGMVLAVKEAASDPPGFESFMRDAAAELRSTRPTAVNLFWAIGRMEEKLRHLAGEPLPVIIKQMESEAVAIYLEDQEMNRRIGEYGAALVPPGARVLTHCNAGALATTGYGTALGVIRAAHEQGKEITVWADETRPLLQGARLTAWELMQDGIPVTLIADNMAGYLMQQGKVDLIIVGADRITAGGDVANKIGTYSLAVLARAHNIPMYIAAPTSTIDFSLEDGRGIPIEERAPEEMRQMGGHVTAPPGVPVYNPAFDVTPAELITAIITDRGVATPPYRESIGKLAGK
ncbi:MAG: S-methyl-5-thioribose-1-phosphate isomerase [Firmicutes bacterium]|nr:S-methyl-5-thioribose-1-phosphate isomerase [Bacillota bacterium]